jgi:selenocysteine lyase/cysteine desulfurase
MRRGLLAELADHTQRSSVAAYELGELPIELLGGVTAAIDHLAALDETATGTRRQRLVQSLTVVGAYEQRLFTALDRRLRAVPGVTVLGENLLGESTARIPVASLTVAGCTPAQVGQFLESRGVSVWTGLNGMSQLMRAIGLDEVGGTVQVGLMPHSTMTEIDQLIDGLGALVRATPVARR